MGTTDTGTLPTRDAVVIHRDLTFEVDGVTYQVVRGATMEDTQKYGMEIKDLSTGFQEGPYYGLDEVRAHVSESIARGLPIVGEMP